MNKKRLALISALLAFALAAIGLAACGASAGNGGGSAPADGKLIRGSIEEVVGPASAKTSGRRR